ncbi:MAG: hypothetical protein ACK58L_17725 [Planctomycetota bacterium]
MPIDFFHAGDAPLSAFSDRKLLQGGLSPVAPRTSRPPFTEPHVARQWLDGVEAGELTEAVSRLITSCSVTLIWTAAQVASTLQHAAGMCLALGHGTLADRCMQEALVHLANGGSPSSVESDIQRWMFLAAVAVSRSDMESARLWLRQASRTLTGHSSELNLRIKNHYLGDLLAIHACILSATEGPQIAAETFHQAAECHRESGSAVSVAGDLILYSRCLRHDSDRAERSRLKLIEAVEMLSGRQSSDEASVVRRLLQLADNDMTNVRTASTPRTMATWN